MVSGRSRLSFSFPYYKLIIIKIHLKVIDTKIMGLIDVVVGTAVSGYVTFKLTNRALERIFFSRSMKVPTLSIKDQLAVAAPITD